MTPEPSSEASRVVSELTTGAELFPSPDVVAIRVDGELRDLHTSLDPGVSVEPITLSSAEGLEILRHSSAHVLAHAGQALHPQAQLGIGPPVLDGF